MARNRVLHNVQDVFVGSTPDETDNLVTGIVGHQVLKRFTRVQSFNYSIDLPQQDALTLGKSKAFSRVSNEPPSVSLSLTYILNGVDNEKRMGLNTELAKCISHDMLTASTKDARNIYLTINEQDQDAQQQKDWSSSYSHSESAVGDASATGYSVVAFQNCYLTNYSLTIQPQSLPQVSLSYSADNMNAYSSGSGIEIPTLQAKSGIVTGDGTEFIIPNQYVDNEQYTGNFTKNYSRTLVTISNAGVSGVTGFLNDEVTSCSIDFSIDRDDIGYVGHKLVSDRKPKVPMMSNLSLDTLVKENITGSFLDNMKENENYNVTVDLKSKNDQTLASYVFSGAKFEGVNYDASLNANKTASLKFSNYMDLENQSEGLFVTGLITSATSGTDVIYPQF